MFKDFEIREIPSFEKAVFAGDAGLVGSDGSGNDDEFPQNLTIVEINADPLREEAV